MKVLVIAEHNQKTLKNSTLNTIAAAQKNKNNVDVLLAGYQCDAVVALLQKINGLQTIFLVEHEALVNPLAENMAPLIADIVRANQHTHVFVAANTWGKNILPRAAALLGVGQISDAIEIVDEQTYKRPIYAGNAIETIRSFDPVQCVTIRVGAFSPVGISASTQGASLNRMDLKPNNSSVFIGSEQHGLDKPDLTSSEVVVSGGRGLKNQANFDKLAAIAAKMHAALGASRAAVDAGLAPNDFQVGQTGKIVSPQLYFAVGISGAIQHVAGIKDSKIIVAINKDPDAPIFAIADYGLVGEIEDILPRWEKWLDTNAKR